MTPDLSIIILTWNTSAITLKCVNSLLSKISKKLKYEIIVVDNGSTDDTEKTFSKLQTIKYINTGSNLGFAKGNNFGAKNALGKYFLFLNSDMEYLSGLESMLEYYIAHNIGLIGPQFLNLDLTPQGSIFPPQTPLNAFKQFWLNKPSFNKYFLNQISLVNSVSGGAVLISQQYFKKIGQWNEKYFFYYEDLDLCRNVLSHHLKIIYYPFCQFIHRHGASIKQVSGKDNGFSRLVRSSKLYHGYFNHYLINLIIWSGQKISKIF